MAALGKNRGPYSLDMVRVRHRGAIVTTIVNSPVFDNYISGLNKLKKFDVGYIPAGYGHRPDLISNIFYGSPKNWWDLMLVNNISDPFEGFKVHEQIIIPKY